MMPSVTVGDLQAAAQKLELAIYKLHHAIAAVSADMQADAKAYLDEALGNMEATLATFRKKAKEAK